jgi:hypothetical protein
VDLKPNYNTNGFFRAKVVDNNDPQQLGRIKVKVYPIMEDTDDAGCPFAMPCWNGGILYIPPVNSWVWVFFEGSDVEKPVWFGMSTPFNGTRFQAGSTGASFGMGAMDTGGMYKEQGAEYPGAVVMRMPMNSTVVFYESGRILIRNASGNTIEMVGNSINITNVNGSHADIQGDTINIANASGSTVTMTGGDIVVESNSSVSIKAPEVGVVGYGGGSSNVTFEGNFVLKGNYTIIGSLGVEGDVGVSGSVVAGENVVAGNAIAAPHCCCCH